MYGESAFYANIRWYIANNSCKYQESIAIYVDVNKNLIN